MATKNLDIPAFRNEKEEALWWEKHRAKVEVHLRSANREKKTLTLGAVLAKSQNKPTLRPVTLRLPADDIATARQLAEDRGLGYQTYIKLLLHDALRTEAGRKSR
jgi:predicted DNA binding CopG/RHH family protein